LLDYNGTLIFVTDFSKKKTEILDFMKFHPVGAELFMATVGQTDGGTDRRMDGRTDMTKLTVDFRSFANAPEK
jgi:hypothetical protein